MEKFNSRVITYPSSVEKSTNHTVMLIDFDIEDIERVALFCKTSQKDFDVYLYRGDIGDLEWLNSVNNLMDKVLINETSDVTITSCERISSNNVIRYFEEHDAK